jgi:hypothetical protein
LQKNLLGEPGENRPLSLISLSILEGTAWERRRSLTLPSSGENGKSCHMRAAGITRREVQIHCHLNLPSSPTPEGEANISEKCRRASLSSSICLQDDYGFRRNTGEFALIPAGLLNRGC